MLLPHDRKHFTSDGAPSSWVGSFFSWTPGGDPTPPGAGAETSPPSQAQLGPTGCSGPSCDGGAPLPCPQPGREGGAGLQLTPAGRGELCGLSAGLWGAGRTRARRGRAAGSRCPFWHDCGLSSERGLPGPQGSLHPPGQRGGGCCSESDTDLRCSCQNFLSPPRAWRPHREEAQDRVI